MSSHRIDVPLRSNAPSTDYSHWVPPEMISAFTGTWAITRVAAGHRVLRHSAADDTSLLIVPCTPPIIREKANRGVRIKSFDVVYDVDTADLDAHSAICRQVTLVNSTAAAIAAHGGTLTGTLSIASADADPLVTRLTLGTPAWITQTTANIIEVLLEITVDAAATSAVDYYGVRVNYDVNLL